MVKIFGKSGKSDINWPLVILVVIAVLIAFPAIPEKISTMFGLQNPSTPSGNGGNGGNGGVTPTGCYIEDTTMTLTSEEMFNPSTTPGGDNKVWINGEDQGLVVNGNSITVSPGDKYKVLWVKNSTTHYSKVTEGVVPCAGTLKLHEKLYAEDLGRAQTSWSTIYNSDGRLNTGSGTEYNQSLGLSDVYQLTIKLKATYEDAIGAPDMGTDVNVLSCKYNSSSIDSLAIETLTKTDTPTMITSSGGMQWASWKFPAMISNAEKSFVLVVDTDATYDAVDGGSWIFCELDDGNYFVNTDTGAVESGVEDDVDTNVGMGKAIHNFTVSVA